MSAGVLLVTILAELLLDPRRQLRAAGEWTVTSQSSSENT